MSNIITIDNSQVRDFTRRLKDMHRSDLPIVIRQTLNDLAFDTKQKTMPNAYGKTFVKRNKTFLKSQSGVKKADGFDTNKMQSEVGITPKSEGGEAAKGLTKQEYGGTQKKPFIYMKKYRGGSNRKMVDNVYFNKIKKVKGEPSVKRRTRKSNFIASAIIAHREGKLLIWDSKGGQTAFLINSIYLGAGNAVKVNATPVADYEANRSFAIKSRPFLRPASKISYQKQDVFFRQNAIKRFKKYMQ